MEGTMQERGRQPLILLVDDQPFFLTYHRNILTAKGFQVLTAADGEEGLREAAKLRPDLIILDMEMPGLDGIEVCSRLKTEERTRHVPVVILTATQDPKLNEKAFKAGAEATVLKSTNTDRLLNLLKVILTTERAQPEG